jgi:RNA polymerase sigma factor (sigma-70 family)
MEWNNGKERSKFEREQRQLRKQYLAAGMSEEQIKEAYEFDLEWYKSRRREAVHTQKLDVEMDEDCNDSDGLNPLLSKFMENFSVNDEYFASSRYGWVDEIKNEKLYLAIKSLSEYELELLTLLFIDGFSQKEIAAKYGLKKTAICMKIGRLKKNLKKFL